MKKTEIDALRLRHVEYIAIRAGCIRFQCLMFVLLEGDCRSANSLCHWIVRQRLGRPCTVYHPASTVSSRVRHRKWIWCSVRRMPTSAEIVVMVTS